MIDVLKQSASYLTMPVMVVWALAMLTALLWPIYQNSGNRHGGKIGMWKSVWLFYAIALWVVLPWFFVTHSVLWYQLAISMALRSVIELILCGLKKWQTRYGVAHDFIHLIIVIACIPVMPAASRIWLGLTAVALLCEIHFVKCFLATGGKPEDGVYFVPDGDEYKWLQRRTAYLLVPQLLVLAVMFVVQFRSHVN
ncbi:hypothetical protein NT6N_12000 [Oceaniferula spumae]|uniref:Uncharacterized protein n=1 Tax=Oceaniferula spumae TaxID=2979115 RepID=A0AAT9FJH2_9BACT